MREVPTPEVRPGTVRVRIAAASVNPVDVKIRGELPVGAPLPAILGCDMAGTVDAIGQGVDGFAAGDPVYGLVGGVRGHGGTLAEFITVDARLLARAPASLALRDAAALPLVGITALDALERVGVGPEDHILVQGGAGGVGHVAVQIARARGARVSVTVGSPGDADIVRDLGAHDTANFREEPVADYVQRLTGGRGFDVVFDTVGGANLENSFAATANSGRIVTTSARVTLDLSPMHARALSLTAVFVLLPLLQGGGEEVHARMLRNLAALVDRGDLRPRIDPERFTLESAPRAHQHFDSGAAVGKIVVEIG